MSIYLNCLFSWGTIIKHRPMVLFIKTRKTKEENYRSFMMTPIRVWIVCFVLAMHHPTTSRKQSSLKPSVSLCERNQNQTAKKTVLVHQLISHISRVHIFFKPTVGPPETGSTCKLCFDDNGCMFVHFYVRAVVCFHASFTLRLSK